MNTALYILTAFALVAMGCDVAEPDVPDFSTPSIADKIDTIDELRDYAARKSPSRVSQLLVVNLTAQVCNALGSGLFVNTTASANGALQATWTEGNRNQLWSLRCWTGSPMFPGGENLPTCDFDLLSPQPLQCVDVIDSTMQVLRGLNDAEEYTLLFQTVDSADPDDLFEVWFADPAGDVWYWRWVQSAAVDVPTS